MPSERGPSGAPRWQTRVTLSIGCHDAQRHQILTAGHTQQGLELHQAFHCCLSQNLARCLPCLKNIKQVSE